MCGLKNFHKKAQANDAQKTTSATNDATATGPTVTIVFFKIFSNEFFFEFYIMRGDMSITLETAKDRFRAASEELKIPISEEDLGTRYGRDLAKSRPYLSSFRLVLGFKS